MLETNALHNPETYNANKTHVMSLSELKNNGGMVTRVRLFSGKTNGTWFAELSYVDGTLPTGETVTVNGLPALGARTSLANDLREWADDEGVDAEEINLMNSGIWSFLY